MPIQIANPDVVRKIERLAQVTGLGKTGAVDAAVGRMLHDLGAGQAESWPGLDAIVEQLRKVPPRRDAFDAIVFDQHGLPK
jgi:antitoxin VapB